MKPATASSLFLCIRPSKEAGAPPMDNRDPTRQDNADYGKIRQYEADYDRGMVYTGLI